MKLDEIKKAALAKSLVKHKWVIQEVVKDLGVSRASIYRMLKRYAIARPCVKEYHTLE